jgi:hypothetical protein
VLRRSSTDFRIPSLFSISIQPIGSGHSSASEFSQTQFPIKNVLHGRPIYREMLCHHSGTHERTLFQKALKSRAKEMRGFPGRSSSPHERSPELNLLSQFLTVDSQIALSLSVHTSFLDMSLLPCPLKENYFTIALCLIRSIPIFLTYVNVCLKCRSKRPQCQTLWADFLAEHL